MSRRNREQGPAEAPNSLSPISNNAGIQCADACKFLRFISAAAEGYGSAVTEQGTSSHKLSVLNFEFLRFFLNARSAVPDLEAIPTIRQRERQPRGHVLHPVPLQRPTPQLLHPNLALRLHELRPVPAELVYEPGGVSGTTAVHKHIRGEVAKICRCLRCTCARLESLVREPRINMGEGD